MTVELGVRKRVLAVILQMQTGQLENYGFMNGKVWDKKKRTKMKYGSWKSGIDRGDNMEEETAGVEEEGTGAESGRGGITGQMDGLSTWPNPRTEEDASTCATETRTLRARSRSRRTTREAPATGSREAATSSEPAVVEVREEETSRGQSQRQVRPPGLSLRQ